MKTQSQMAYERSTARSNYSRENLDADISRSYGHPIMSPEDTKMAVLHLMFVVKYQQEQLDLLAKNVYVDVPEKKSLIKRLLHK